MSTLIACINIPPLIPKCIHSLCLRPFLSPDPISAPSLCPPSHCPPLPPPISDCRARSSSRCPRPQVPDLRAQLGQGYPAHLRHAVSCLLLLILLRSFLPLQQLLMAQQVSHRVG